MPIAQKARRFLDLNSLGLPPAPKVISVEVEDYTDWTGEPALRVQVLLDETVDEENLNGQAIGDLKFAIQESLWKENAHLFPYIFLAKPSELMEADEE